MKHPKAKRIACVALACALLLGLGIVFTGVNGVVEQRSTAEAVASKLEGIGMSIANLLQTHESVIQDCIQQARNSVNLTALSLRAVVEREGDGAIRSYDSGFVLRKGPDGLVLPQDQQPLPQLEPRQIAHPPFTLDSDAAFEGDDGGFWTCRPDAAGEAGDDDGEAVLLCMYRRIQGAYYFAGFTPVADIRAYISAHADLEGAMRRLEESYDCRIAAFEGDSGENRLIYCSDRFGGGFERVGDLGILPEDGLTFGHAAIDGENYLYAVSEPFAVEGLAQSADLSSFRAVYLTPARNLAAGLAGTGAILTGIALLIFVTLLVWAFSIMELMRRKVITRTQRRHYGPTHSRLIAVSIGVIGFVLVFAGSLFSDVLNDVYDRTRGSQGVLETLHVMLADNGVQAASAARQREEQYTGYAGRIAGLLAEFPELKTAETLSEMNRTIGSDYLMLYDDKGRETLSSSRYALLKYGTEQGSTTHDFRRLISGVPSIVHEACVDEVTGLERQLIGVSMDDGNPADGYASLIVALEPDKGSRLSDGDIVRLLTNPRNLIFSVDRESGTVLQSSDESLVGKKALELGLPEGSLRDGFMDFFRLNGERWYGCSAESGGRIDYCASRIDSMVSNHLNNSLSNGLLFLAAYILLALAVLWDYTEKNVDALGGRVVDDAVWLTRQDEIANAAGQENRRGLLGRMRDGWACMSPERRVRLTLEILLAIGLALLVFGLGGRSDGELEIINYVLNGRWTPGLNIFALARIVLLAETTVLAVLAVGMVFSLIGGMLEAKGRTIVKLLESLLKYLIVIVALFTAFDALGFDSRTLLASLGICSLAISLGAKELVSDIISGLGIVFSGEYQIGDIVEIDGFKGRVLQIGVRSTTMVNADGNMKNISNRSISDITNLSRMNTWYTMQISVNYDQPLERVEEMLVRELPHVGKHIDEILQGPVYRGITEVGSGSVTLALAAECREQDLAAVRSKLNLEILRIFERNNIPIR